MPCSRDAAVADAVLQYAALADLAARSLFTVAGVVASISLAASLSKALTFIKENTHG